MRKFIFIFFLIQVVCASAQEYRFNVFSQEEGLPQPYVYDIIQANNGFLYVATGDGLASFGGQRFNKFTRKVGLSENFCNSLFCDSKQRIWIGHFEGGISCLENGIFRKINIGDVQAAKIVGFAEDANQNVYVANTAGSVYLITQDKLNVFVADELPPANEIKVRDNKLYVAGQEGLLVFDLATKSKSYTTIESTKNKNITCFEFGKNGELFIAIDGEGIEMMKAKEGTFVSVKKISTELKSKRLNVKDICLKGNNEIWVSLNGEGLCVVKMNAEREIEKVLNIGPKNGLKSVYVSKIFVDKEENVWLGTIGEGLLQFMSDRFELFSKKNFLKFDNIVSVAVDDVGNIYTTDESQLYSFNPNDSSNYLIQVVKPGTDEQIRCSYLNKSTGELWIGTGLNLFVFDIHGAYPKLKMQLPEFRGRAINYITNDNLGQTLVCTTEGLFYLDASKKLIREFNTDKGAPHNNFNSLFVDQFDKYWIFSPETPLYHLYNGEITLEKDLDSSVSFRFNCAAMDNSDLLWFGTEGDGIFTYSKKRKPNYVKFGVNKGLASDYIYGIITTNNGDVVACHKNGISIKYANLKTFRAINRNSGLPANNINSNAIYKDKNGCIWLGSTEGLIKYSPSRDKINSIPPSLSLLSISFNDSLKSVTDTLFELKYGKYELAIEVLGVSLTNPKGVTYRYILEGHEGKMRYTDNRFINYPALGDGRYRFMIFSKNDDGFENPVPLTFTIIIAEPIWKKWWFYVLLIVGVTIGFSLFFRARTKKLKREKLRLEEMVNEKTKELVIEKERVEKSNELLHEKNRDITDSITYAKRIQNAVLPQLENMHKHLDLFILFKPRDIVSGDFYWYYVTPSYYYLAVVDCTGHGVPGAFMSLLGSTFIDQIMIEAKEPAPSRILVELDIKINSAFKQVNADNKIGDGMDMSVCRISKKGGEVTIASANRPIYLLKQGELIETKSNIYSIGGYFDGIDKNFTDTSLKVEAGDCLYMFSDGYGDQFGGAKNRRFSTRKMKIMFSEVCNLATTVQCERIDEEYEKWRGDNEQIDDVCVIGIKFK